VGEKWSDNFAEMTPFFTPFRDLLHAANLRHGGPVYGNEKENWRILTDKEIYVIVKKPTITETIRLKNPL
jgi:hypothetical protein